MKRILALVAVLVMLLTVLTGCGAKKPEGEYYSADLGFSIVFEDDDTLIMEMMGQEVSCKYEIDGDKITLEMQGEKETADFEFDGDTVSIDGDKFTKVKD